MPIFDDGPPDGEADPRALLLGYLDWYRAALLRKVDGLPDDLMRAPVEPLGWSPAGLVSHLTGVERRWLRWGFGAEDVVSWADDEWTPAASTADVLAGYRAEVDRCRAAVDGVPLDRRAKAGGRFPDPDATPSLGRILFHLLQEYARHVGHLDIVRELLDGSTGE
ncbi:MAG TPA: DinB family protein [Mycobacteriales bacterium]|nr:DinB family protein [Mycobacteriales bacterium]